MRPEESQKTPNSRAPSEPELHQAPSMLWFVIPLGLIVVYALLSR